MHTSSWNPETKQNHSDRRSEPRKEIDVLMNRFLSGYPYLCRASDISRTGMRIHPISAAGPTGRFVGLQFQLPGSPDVISASGEIVSTISPTGTVGVRFTRMPRVSRERISQFLAAQASA
jgi:hypothetical protein